MNILPVMGLMVLVAGLAWLLRKGSVGRAATSAAPEAPERARVDDPHVGEELEEELAVTSDGDVFIPDGRNVRLMPLHPDEIAAHHEDLEAGFFALPREERLQLVARRGKPGQAFGPGDLSGARIRRGAAIAVPWCLETLGRDGEYIPFAFETEDGARAALALLEKYRIVRRPLDEDRRPIPPSSEDFEEGRRRFEESWRALAMEHDPHEGIDPGTHSDRR